VSAENAPKKLPGDLVGQVLFIRPDQVSCGGLVPVSSLQGGHQPVTKGYITLFGGCYCWVAALLGPMSAGERGRQAIISQIQLIQIIYGFGDAPGRGFS
jgi:hypothetical protein